MTRRRGTCRGGRACPRPAHADPFEPRGSRDDQICGSSMPAAASVDQVRTGGVALSESVLDMSMSLDGYIAAPNDLLGGEDDHPLHNWFAPGGEFVKPSGPAGDLIDEMSAAGAVVSGRRTAELMDHWGGSHNGLPIFVPSHRPPGPAARWGYPLVTYVTDGIASAMEQAKAAAGDRHVHVIGGYTGAMALEARGAVVTRTR